VGVKPLAKTFYDYFLNLNVVNDDGIARNVIVASVVLKYFLLKCIGVDASVLLNSLTIVVIDATREQRFHFFVLALWCCDSKPGGVLPLVVLAVIPIVAPVQVLPFCILVGLAVAIVAIGGIEAVVVVAVVIKHCVCPSGCRCRYAFIIQSASTIARKNF